MDTTITLRRSKVLSSRNYHPAPITNINEQNLSNTFSYNEDSTKLVLVMVGLPATGKTFIARKLSSYLSWLGIAIKSFNIGAYRRLGAKDTVGKVSANYFDPSNEKARKQREEFARYALKDLVEYLIKGGQVAILDGTNSTKLRRRMIRNFFKNSKFSFLNIKIVFILSECNDKKLIESNIMNVKLNSPDYASVPPNEAVKDFLKRRKFYEKAYQDITDDEGSYIKLIDASTKVIGHKITGYLPSRILYYLMHLNLKRIPIFLTRHGESEYNVLGKIGGDAPLSDSGKRYSKAMTDWISMQPEFHNNLSVWCSTLKRTIETAKPFKKYKRTKVYQWRALCELDVGACDGMTYNEIKLKYPSEYKQRLKNKLSYRYPRGESYKDLIQRLEPVIFELERSTYPVLIIAHRAILRCLYGYFLDINLNKLPYLDIDMHTVYKLVPNDYRTEVDRLTFGLVASKYDKDEKFCDTPRVTDPIDDHLWNTVKRI